MRSHLLDEIAAAQAAGRPAGVTSVCSAHPTVLEVALRRAATTGSPVLVEATCNQVNQDGGYTGMTPLAFRDSLLDLAASVGTPGDQVVLGGDHLGPNPWKSLPADEAMRRSEVLVADFVAAGYTKLHLDTSIRCGDDPPALPTAVVAERAARLAGVAEHVAGDDAGRLRYVIGTEVPVPGGESSGEHGIHVSAPDDVAETVALTRDAFSARGVADAWRRVRAVVAQPGVEFSDREIFGYEPGQAAHLYGVLPAEPPTVFEAHSTDYQHRDALRALVRDHFAILKVGPGLTFAYREAVFGLAAIEQDLLGTGASGVREVLDVVMREDPRHWQAFYPDDPAAAALARSYSRSDRSRYYWPRPEVQAALATMIANLERTGLPDELVSQHLAWLRGVEAPGVVLPRRSVSEVLQTAVGRVLDLYQAASGV
jgi:D-tagatose-1,6-bisphosphate aldolase subunit GatZ/KbaZ